MHMKNFRPFPENTVLYNYKVSYFQAFTVHLSILLIDIHVRTLALHARRNPQ